MGDRIVYKTLYDFYHHLSALHPSDWTLFSDMLQGLPDVAPELEGLKRVAKQQSLQDEPDVNAFIGGSL